MTFDEYSKQAIKTDTFGGNKTTIVHERAFISKLLGLVGEAGEVAEKFKKIVRDREGVIGEDDREAIAKELGDVLWYINALSYYLGFTLEDVANANLDKLLDRSSRGVIRGSGDNR